ncbi:ABC transporter permease [Citreimonas salinaria]|uniref:Capsular polysaccharide transport system permease protein n=1 Tax=Citreimonas salinaria TaxID=321339 RepID=A0A1H3N5N4_9RHOB|nr:ABC transporter permease [Citreimonas salinaria]SDY83529.1 capsular polysaccharide transport system permease protein [Citreimonas salinaria]
MTPPDAAAHPVPGLPDDRPASGPRDGVNRRFATLRAVSALMIREMATRYGRSPGGYAWAVLEPVGAILILSLGFSLLMANPPVGKSFLLFYATGFLPFQLYQSLALTVGRSVNFSRALLMYPAVTWVDAVAARFTLNLLTELLATVLVGAGILLAIEARVTLVPGPMLGSLAIAALTGLGVGVLNCALFGLFPAWMQIWSILTRPLFLASGIFFIYDDLPPAVQDVLWFNPLIHAVGLMRTGVYPTYAGNYLSPAYAAGVGLVCLFFGVLLMSRFHRHILNEGS